PGTRSKSFRPVPLSSLEIERLILGCEVCIIVAAAVIDPESITALKASKWLSLIMTIRASPIRLCLLTPSDPDPRHLNAITYRLTIAALTAGAEAGQKRGEREIGDAGAKHQF